MWNEFVGIIKAVQVKQPEAAALKAAITSSTDHQQADIKLDDMEPEEKSSGDCREYQALYALCKACVYYESKLILALENALNSICDAIEGFRCCGNIFNEGLGCRVLGIIYNKQGKTNLAIAEFDRAITIFKQCRDLYESGNDFKREADCERQIHECKKAIEKIRKESSRKGTEAQSIGKYGPKQPWPAARLNFSVYDFGHASRVGKYVLDDEPISEIEIEEIVIGGEPHKLYCAQEGNYEITLTVGGNYRWFCVAGESMNQAEPTAIQPNDYVLADINRNANIGDIVIANLRNPPTPAERAGIIKRFEKEFLKSESSEDIPRIPITEIEKISGVVIAVAKPI